VERKRAARDREQPVVTASTLLRIGLCHNNTSHCTSVSPTTGTSATFLQRSGRCNSSCLCHLCL